MNRSTTYCVLMNKKMPWGDYGSILLSGMAVHRLPLFGRLQIERTGPFMPPITNAGLWRFVVSHQMASLLKRDHPDISLKRAFKRKVTWVDWRSWDASAGEPQLYPAGGQPEDYILKKWHSVRASIMIGPVYQFDGKRLTFPTQNLETIPHLDSHGGKIVLLRDVTGYRTIFRQDIAHWLVDHSDGWVELNPNYSWTVE